MQSGLLYVWRINFVASIIPWSFCPIVLVWRGCCCQLLHCCVASPHLFIKQYRACECTSMVDVMSSTTTCCPPFTMGFFWESHVCLEHRIVDPASKAGGGLCSFWQRHVSFRCLHGSAIYLESEFGDPIAKVKILKSKNWVAQFE